MPAALPVTAATMLVGAIVRADEVSPRPWDEIPAVKFLGIAIGVALLIAAIRAMFGKRNR